MREKERERERERERDAHNGKEGDNLKMGTEWKLSFAK